MTRAAKEPVCKRRCSASVTSTTASLGAVVGTEAAEPSEMANGLSSRISAISVVRVATAPLPRTPTLVPLASLRDVSCDHTAPPAPSSPAA